VPGAAGGSSNQQQQQQQQQQLVHDQSLQTAQRLHQSITQFSSNMLLRRVVRSSSPTTSQPPPAAGPSLPQGLASTATAGAAHATSSGRRQGTVQPPAAVAPGTAVVVQGGAVRGPAAEPQQQHTRQSQRLSLDNAVRQLSLDDTMVAVWPGSLRVDGATAPCHVEDLPSNVQQAPERVPSSVRSARRALRQQLQVAEAPAGSPLAPSRSSRAGTKQQEAPSAVAPGSALSKQLQLHEVIGKMAVVVSEGDECGSGCAVVVVFWIRIHHPCAGSCAVSVELPDAAKFGRLQCDDCI
jgi:hypothetical protein